LIFCFLIGDRTLNDAHSFIKDLVSRIEGLPLFVSDELPHYANALNEAFHKIEQPVPTGRRGRPRKPIKVVDKELDYATVHKTRENGRVVNVETRVVFGSAERIKKRLEESPSNTINTAYVERSNLNWRMWDAHLTRKSLMFAKSFRWLKAKFSLCVGFYNLIRPHESLSRGEDRVFRANTPAMMAGITDHPWSVMELLNYKI